MLCGPQPEIVTTFCDLLASEYASRNMFSAFFLLKFLLQRFSLVGGMFEFYHGYVMVLGNSRSACFPELRIADMSSHSWTLDEIWKAALLFH